MAYKIALSPEDRSSNAYHPQALYQGRSTNEHEQMCRCADLLEKELLRCGFAVKNMQYGNMYDRVAEGNGWGADLYIALHTNGFDGTVAGTRVHCYPSDKSRRIGKLIQDRIAPLSPGKSEKLVESSGLYELKATKMAAVLPEFGFHDNREEAQWLVDSMDDIARETAMAVCDFFGVTYVPEAEEAPAVTFEVRQVVNGEVVRTWVVR
ncbi:MAG: N-acetylmuramoyl-L-alanine amidase [Oscillospiraceae bacterium]|nr:N-acetylmuramoyl-L-alanine amidase [Oscillospiraceae bacterium]